MSSSGSARGSAGCLAAVLSAAPAGMEAVLHVYVQVSTDAMSVLCAGMALHHLCGPTAENKRAEQENT